MNHRAFYGDPKNKDALISKLITKRIIKQQEMIANKVIFGTHNQTRPHTLSEKTLDKPLSEIIIDYQIDHNIPPSVSSLIEALYQELNEEQYLYFPEIIYNNISVEADLTKVWYEFVHWFLGNKMSGIKQLAETIDLLECIEDIASAYVFCKEKLVNSEEVHNDESFEQLSHNFMQISKKIEKAPLTETSMMIYAINNALVDSTYIYDAFSGIYKHPLITQEHYTLYAQQLFNILRIN